MYGAAMMAPMTSGEMRALRAVARAARQIPRSVPVTAGPGDLVSVQVPATFAIEWLRRWY